MTPAATAPDPRFNPEIGVERHVPVQDTMLRALGVLRFVVLLNAIGIYWVRYDGYDHPLAGWLVMGLLVVWTAFAVWAYAAPARRTPVLLVADLLVAVAAIAVSPYVKGEGLNATLPGFWVMGAVLAWAIVWRWVGGLTAAVVVSIADISIRDDITQKIYGNIFLLIVGGAIVGFLSGLLQQMAGQRDRAERAAAAAAERQRLARVVHDGVLQVLALVQRRAPELGPDGRELGRLAGEQEVQLRGLVQQGSRDLVAPLGDRDLVQLLAGLQSTNVHVAVPGTPAMLPAERASEVLAAVESCLSNVRHHVGRDAEAWVLLEELDDRWVVSVRDDGPGIPEGRLEESAVEGRLGVQQSIIGRLQDLGGTATVRSAAGQGTEWQLDVPR
jgi:signal transduction histidine kinase